MENVNVIHVNQENFEKEVLQSDKPVLIDFFASWCGPCQRLSKIIEQISADCPNIKVVKIDVDESQMLAMQFGVRSIPTVVVMKNGKETKRSIGFATRDQLLTLLD